jgi:hypothetical protein
MFVYALDAAAPGASSAGFGRWVVIGDVGGAVLVTFYTCFVRALEAVLGTNQGVRFAVLGVSQSELYWT